MEHLNFTWLLELIILNFLLDDAKLQKEKFASVCAHGYYIVNTVQKYVVIWRNGVHNLKLFPCSHSSYLFQSIVHHTVEDPGSFTWNIAT